MVGRGKRHLTLKSCTKFCLAIPGPWKDICWAICLIWSAAAKHKIFTYEKEVRTVSTTPHHTHLYHTPHICTIVSTKNERIDTSKAKYIEEVPGHRANPERGGQESYNSP